MVVKINWQPGHLSVYRLVNVPASLNACSMQAVSHCKISPVTFPISPATVNLFDNPAIHNEN